MPLHLAGVVALILLMVLVHAFTKGINRAASGINALTAAGGAGAPQRF
jgi:hypothetical protein